MVKKGERRFSRLPLLLAGVIAAGLLLTGCGREKVGSMEEALDIVLKEAQLSESDITIVAREQEREFFHTEYTFEFLYGDTKYEYKVNARSGKIVSFSHEPADWNAVNGGGQSSADPSQTGSGQGSGQTDGQEAGQTAGQDSQSAGQATGQDGQSSGQATGQDSSQSSGQANSQGGAAGGQGTAALTEQQAKEIALKDAGFSEADVSRLHIELDRDNGVLEYEIEFSQGGMEYSYSINADTGEIRDYEKERD